MSAGKNNQEGMIIDKNGGWGMGGGGVGSRGVDVKIRCRVSDFGLRL